MPRAPAALMLAAFWLAALPLEACNAPRVASTPADDLGPAGDPTNNNADGSPTDIGAPSDPRPACSDCWRSTLFPDNWTPAFEDSEGHSLPDFSYAGYHNGEVALPDLVSGSFFNVLDYGADNQGVSDATAAIQQAIDDASIDGGRVLLPAGSYRCDGLLEVHAPNVMIRGAGPASTQVLFTRDTGMSSLASLTFSGNVQEGPDLLLVADAAPRDMHVWVSDASSLAVGDDISIGWIITDAFVAEHGMTGIWQISNGQWRPFFRRNVVALDLTTSPNMITIDVPIRYPTRTRDQASVRRESGYLSECGVEALAVSNAVGWDAAWTNSQAHAIHMVGVKDCFINQVESFPSPLAPGGHHLQSGGIRLTNSKRVTIAESRMEKAQNRGGGGNGYLFEIVKSGEILIRDTVGHDGRHNFIQNWDFGTSGCVFLRCDSAGGTMLGSKDDSVGTPAWCEYHHSLAMANLVDGCVLQDGWFGGNRLTESTGAGHTTTQGVFWNVSGGGLLTSTQYGWGYVIGPGDMTVLTTLLLPQAIGTAPEDWVERPPGTGPLNPTSLYEDQLRRRLGIPP